MVFVLLSNGRAVAVLSQHASGNSIVQGEGLEAAIVGGVFPL